MTPRTGAKAGVRWTVLVAATALAAVGCNCCDENNNGGTPTPTQPAELESYFNLDKVEILDEWTAPTGGETPVLKIGATGDGTLTWDPNDVEVWSGGPVIVSNQYNESVDIILAEAMEGPVSDQSRATLPTGKFLRLEGADGLDPDGEYPQLEFLLRIETTTAMGDGGTVQPVIKDPPTGGGGGGSDTE
jgi:hypothetical protein